MFNLQVKAVNNGGYIPCTYFYNSFQHKKRGNELNFAIPMKKEEDHPVFSDNQPFMDSSLQGIAD